MTLSSRKKCWGTGLLLCLIILSESAVLFAQAATTYSYVISAGDDRTPYSSTALDGTFSVSVVGGSNNDNYKVVLDEDSDFNLGCATNMQETTYCTISSSGGSCSGTGCVSSGGNDCEFDATICGDVYLKIECDNWWDDCNFDSITVTATSTVNDPPPPPVSSPPPSPVSSPPPSPSSTKSCPASGTLQTSECEFRIMDMDTKTVSSWVSMSDLVDNTLSSTGIDATGEIKGSSAVIGANVCGTQTSYTHTSCYFTGGIRDYPYRWYLQSRVKDCPSQVCYSNGNVLDWYCDHGYPGNIYYEQDEWWTNDDTRYTFSALDAYADCVAPPPPPLPPPYSPPPGTETDSVDTTQNCKCSCCTGNYCSASIVASYDALSSSACGAADCRSKFPTLCPASGESGSVSASYSESTTNTASTETSDAQSIKVYASYFAAVGMYILMLA